MNCQEKDLIFFCWWAWGGIQEKRIWRLNTHVRGVELRANYCFKNLSRSGRAEWGLTWPVSWTSIQLGASGKKK